MKKLTIFTIELFSVMAVALLVARALGTSRPRLTLSYIISLDTEIINGVRCWKKICPEQSSIPEARNTILTSGGKLVIDAPSQLRANYQAGYSVVLGNAANRSSPIDVMNIGFTSGQSSPDTLGDAILNFGRPIMQGRNYGDLYICFEGY